MFETKPTTPPTRRTTPFTRSVRIEATTETSLVIASGSSQSTMEVRQRVGQDDEEFFGTTIQYQVVNGSAVFELAETTTRDLTLTLQLWGGTGSTDGLIVASVPVQLPNGTTPRRVTFNYLVSNQFRGDVIWLVLAVVAAQGEAAYNLVGDLKGSLIASDPIFQTNPLTAAGIARAFRPT